MSVAFILNPGYNTINNVHHTFWNIDEDNIKNESLNPVLAVATSLSAPSHIVTGGTTPAQLFMSDPITLETDAPQFKAPILQAPSAELEEITELTPAAGITFLNDAHFTSGTGVDEVVRDIDGVGTLTCDTLKYTTLDPAITPGDASTWSEYPATQDVDLATFALTGTSSLVNIKGSVSVNTPTGGIYNQTTTDDASSYAYLRVASAQSDGSKFSALNIQAIGADTAKEISFENLPRSANLVSYGGDLCLIPKDNLQLTYGATNNDKAITINSSGAVAFDTDFNGEDPVITGSFGTAGQIVQSNGSSAPPSWVAAPSASNWSTYAATSSINTANNSITNASGSAVTISSPITSITNNGSTELFIKANNDAVSTAVLHFQSGADPDAASSGYIYMNPSSPPSGGASSFTNLPNSLSVSSGGTSDLVLSAGGYYPTNCHISYAVNQAYTINPSGALAFNSSNYGLFTLGNFGTTGQVIQSNGSSAPPTWVNAPSASNWSTYDATSDVDLASYSLTDSLGDVKISKPVVITNTDDKKTKLISLVSPINNNTVQTALSLSSNTGYATQSVVQVSSNPITLTAASMAQRSGGCIIANDGDMALVPSSTGSVRLAYSSGSKATTINSNGALAFNASYTGGVFTEGNFGTTGYVASSAGSSSPPTWVDVNTLITKTDNILYVSKNGSDSNKGTIALQYLTIQAAINAATLSYPQQVTILIAPGVYSGNLSITSPNITLLGYAPSANQNLLTQIVGNISIACTVSQDLFYSQIGIFNLQVAGSITDTSSAVHSLNIEQCRLASSGRIVWQNSSANNRTRLERVVLLHGDAGAGTDPLLCFSSGMATLNLLDVTSKDNAPVLQFDGTATLNTCTLCTFSSTTTSPTAAPIVYIAIANGGTAPLSQKGFAFAYCAFTYSSPVARALSSGKNCGIVTDSITGNVNLIITYNAFNLLLCDATCFVVSDINKNTPTKASTVRFFSNLSTYLATGIDTLVGNKTTFAAVA